MFSGESVDSVYLCDELIEDRRPFDLPFSIDFVSIILLQKQFYKKYRNSDACNNMKTRLINYSLD